MTEAKPLRGIRPLCHSMLEMEASTRIPCSSRPEAMSKWPLLIAAMNEVPKPPTYVTQISNLPFTVARRPAAPASSRCVYSAGIDFGEGEEGVRLSCRDRSRSKSGDGGDCWVGDSGYWLTLFERREWARFSRSLRKPLVSMAPASNHFQGMMNSRADASRFRMTMPAKRELGSTQVWRYNPRTVGMSKAELCHL